MSIYFGDICIPWITGKDTSISRDVVEKNFVDQNPQFFELNPDLESGTYNLILNETYSDKNESFISQQDSVLSMVSRHGTEFPFSVGNDEGYLVVESADTSIDPRQEIREATIQARILDQSTFNSAIELNAYAQDNDFSIEEGASTITYIGFPSSVDLFPTPSWTISSSEGDIDLYPYRDSEYRWEIVSGLMDAEQKSICRLFNSTGDRIYSDSLVVDTNSDLENSLARVNLGSNTSDIDIWNGTSWSELGSLNYSFGNGYPSKNVNREIELTQVNGNKISMFHSFPGFEYTFSGKNDFIFEPNSWGDISFVDSWGHYAVWTDSTDSTSEDIIMIRSRYNGSFFSSGSTSLGLQNLDPLEEQTVYIGIVLDDLTIEETVESYYTRGSRRRTFIQQ